MPQSRPQLTFYSDELPPVYIDGVVESFEPNMFSIDPEIQISFLGLRPEFIDIGSHEVSGPIVSGTPEATINYQGTLSAGFIVQIKAPTDMDAFSGDFIVRNTVRGIDHEFRFSDAVINTTKFVELNTQRYQRYLRSVPVDEDDPFTDILAKMDLQSEWPELLPGTNVISIITEAVGLSFTLNYVNRFGGL